MTAHALKSKQEETAPLPVYDSILVAVDSSDHSNRARQETLELASCFNSKITATHVYAAKLHDIRFKQMEGGLPEEYRMEDELERQRDVHDDLITRGLSIITDSYLDQVERDCSDANIQFKRRPLEGKNYRELVRECNNNNYDLLVVGGAGLGAVHGNRLGTVCQRVARRSDIDTLIIKDPEQSIKKGLIVVGVDGSTRGYGGLLTALSLAQKWGVKVKVVAAFDPYYHYVAFNRIAGVLSEEAGKVFKFKEQEKLHEDIIDSGLAKIYQGHLKVAESIAADHEMEIETVLLDGKPHDVIMKYLKKVKPSLLILGKTGVHADAELDIGGNSEYLLHDAECAVLLSQRQHQPEVDRLASVTTSWSIEAERRMERVPSFVRPMARMAILRYAQEKGHTIITERIVEEATAELMPDHAEQAMGEIVAAHDAGDLKRRATNTEVIRWDDDATALLKTVDELSLRGNLSMRAEKKARAQGRNRVEKADIEPFMSELLSNEPANGAKLPQEITWQAAALARLARVPEGFMRKASKDRIEQYARQNNINEITFAVAEQGLTQARKAMEESMGSDSIHSTPKTNCPYKQSSIESDPIVNSRSARARTASSNITWSAAAEARMSKVPVGFMRDLTRQRIEAFATRHKIDCITPQIIDEKYAEWNAGSAKQQMQMQWDEHAAQRIEKIPDFVRGMVIKETEQCAAQNGMTTITEEILNKATAHWKEKGIFHSESAPDMYKK